MKKIYSSPEIQIVKIKVSNMVCVSAVTTDEEITESSGFGSRESDGWFDDEE